MKYTIFALIDHSPVGRIHSEEWASTLQSPSIDRHVNELWLSQFF